MAEETTAIQATIEDIASSYVEVSTLALPAVDDLGRDPDP